MIEIEAELEEQEELAAELDDMRLIKGDNGITPHIGANGHWFFGETDTGTKAEGTDGDDGIGIESVTQNADYTLTITLTDGSTVTTFPVKGAKGDIGVGIESVTQNADYTLTILFTDGRSFTTSAVKGEKGNKGDKGDRGVSPVISVATISGGHRVTITDAEGQHIFNVMDGEDATISRASITAALGDGSPNLFSGNYGDLQDKPVIPTRLSELASDAANRTVTDVEKTGWNQKADKDEILYPELTVSTETGNTVTAVCGQTTVTAEAEEEKAVLLLPEYGVWTVTVSDGTAQDSEDITVDTVKQYALTMNLDRHIYGVSWDKTASTVLSRTDGAALFAEPVPYVAGAESCSSPFDTLAPWSGMTVVEDEEAGTMVKIPKFWYKWTDTAGSLKLQIATYAADGFHVSPAHADRGDGAGERDEVLIGRYHCDTTGKSVTAASALPGKTRAECRALIHTNGENVWQWDIAMLWTVRMLYLVEYADWDTQKTIGWGCGAGARADAGYTDSMPYHTGTMLSAKDTYGNGTQYRHIEGLWENVNDWVDGIYADASNIYVISDPAFFSDTENGTAIAAKPELANVTKSWTVPTAPGLEYCLIPQTDIYAADSYITDRANIKAAGGLMYTGGRYNVQEKYCGLFMYDMASTETTTLWGISSRSMKL